MRKGGNGQIEERVISKVREVETVHVNEKDITEALADKIRQVVEDVLKERVLYKPVSKIFEYADPKPYDYPVPIPKLNGDKLHEAILTVVQSIDIESIIRNQMKPVVIEKPVYKDKKVVLPYVDTAELKAVMGGYVKEAFRSIDLKALLKEALVEIKFPVTKIVDGEVIKVPQIEKGRTVIEHNIISRQKVEIHTVHQIKDKEGNLITTLKSGDE